MDTNIDQSENQSEILTNIEDSQTFYKLYDTKNNMITNILNKYEMISNGSVPYISNPEKYDNIYDIVIEELKQKKLPFIIKRTLNGNDEYLKLEDFIII